jgi:hypothetical protein
MHRSSHVPLLLVLLVASLPCIAQPHSALLPQVQQLHYGQGSIPLCNLAVPDSSPSHDRSLADLNALLRQHCGSRRHGTVPIHLAAKQLGDSTPGSDDRASRDSRESYQISITATGVSIHSNTSAGIFYAIQTLRQLVEGDTLPFVDIQDWPSLPYRGFMMDMSHGGVVTLAEVESQIDELARWKANQYFFYVETDLDQPGYPLLNKPSNWSAEDIHTIVAYALARHIDVVPCVELFGHLHDLFRIEKYSSMAALPHGGEANPANPDVQHLLEDWLRSYAALFPSPWIHLGFDEPFELERAGSAAAGVAPDTLWLQHLQRMAKLATSLGKRPIFWADIDEGAFIFNKYPALAAGLPPGAVAAPWFYDARSSYDNLLDLFAANHVPIIVASGISDWDNITPDFESTFINIDGFLAAGRKASTIGLLNTEWSDSALAMHREALPALAYGAIAAWQSTPVDREHFFGQYAAITCSKEDAPHMAAALKAIELAQSLLLKSLGTETSFRMFDDPFQPATLARAKTMQPQLRESRLRAEAAEEQLLSLKDSKSDEAASLLLGARMLDLAAMKFLYAVEIAANFDALPDRPSRDDVQYLLKREGAARNHSRVDDLIDLTGELQSQYRTEWLKQYKPYRLSTALARWQAEQIFWLHFQQNIWYLTRNFKPGDARPTLQQLLATH